MGDKTILTGNQVYSFNYSKTPMTQTRTAHLPWMIQTLPIAQKNKYLGIFYFIMKLYVVYILMSTFNISLLQRRSTRLP